MASIAFKIVLRLVRYSVWYRRQKSGTEMLSASLPAVGKLSYLGRRIRYKRGLQHLSEENYTGPEVSTRSLIIGTILAFFLNLACPYSVLVLQNAGLTSDYIAAGAMMIFLLLVGLFNPLIKVAYRPWALRSGEMVVIYVMMIVASAIPTWGLVTNLFHILTRLSTTPPQRTAGPNSFSHLFPTGSPHVIQTLPAIFTRACPWGSISPGPNGPCRCSLGERYAGRLPVDGGYHGYISPTVDRARAVGFPLTQLPIEMLRGADEGIFPRLFRNPLMWIGFSIPFVIQMLTGLHHYFFFVQKSEPFSIHYAFSATHRQSRHIRQLCDYRTHVFSQSERRFLRLVFPSLEPLSNGHIQRFWIPDPKDITKR